MKVAICYDWLDSFGGAERALVALLELYPHAHVYTLVRGSHLSWLKPEPTVLHTSLIQHIPFIRSNRLFHALFGYFLWMQFRLHTFDVVISVTSDQAKALRHTRHLCYCLTPPRYLWSEFKYYTETGLTAAILRLIATPLRVMDFYAARKISCLVGVSEEVAARIKRVYGLKVQVIYPIKGL